MTIMLVLSQIHACVMQNYASLSSSPFSKMMSFASYNNVMPTAFHEILTKFEYFTVVMIN